jgi:integrase
VEILNILDDHSRVAIASTARLVTTGPDVVDTILGAFTTWGTPAGLLTDNGAIFTAKQRGDGRTALEILLGELGIKYRHTPHVLRHTCASLLISTCANIKVVQRQLGHATAAMTLDRSGHLYDADLTAAADELGTAMTAAAAVSLRYSEPMKKVRAS